MVANFTYLYIYIYIYICTDICICLQSAFYIYIYIYICTYIYIYIYIYIYSHMHKHAHVCVHVCEEKTLLKVILIKLVTDFCFTSKKHINWSAWIKNALMIIILLLERFLFHSHQLLVFHKSLNSCKSPQVSKILSILAYLNNAMVWVPISSTLFFQAFENCPKCTSHNWYLSYFHVLKIFF